MAAKIMVVKKTCYLVFMTNRRLEALPLRNVVARRLRAARELRGLTREALAKRCAELGVPDLNYHVVVSLENARREPTVQQILTAALALDIPPLHLIWTADDGSEALKVSESVNVSDPVLLRRWMAGQQPLEVSDGRAYNDAAIQRATLPTEAAPAVEYGQLFLQRRAAELAAEFQAETARVWGQAHGQVRGIVARLRSEVAAGKSPEELLRELDTVAEAVGPSA